MKTWEKKLLEWHEAGLLSKDQENKIREHESKIPSYNWILSAIFLLGAFVIGIGIISIIAANWQLIPPSIKLINIFIFLFIAALIIYKTADRSKTLYFDALIGLFLLLCLGSIGLIPQIYQTGGRLSQAFMIWLVITLPVMLQARTAAVSSIWLFIFGITYFAELSLGEWDLYNNDHFIVVSLPLILLLFINIFQKWLRPILLWSMHLCFIIFALLALVVSDSFVLQRGYTETDHLHPTFWILIGMGIINFVVLSYSNYYSRIQKIIAKIALGSFLILASLRFLVDSSPSLIPAIFSMCVLSAIAFLHAARREENLFQFYFLLIALRFLILYFQALGGLAATGIGLIFSGLIIIGTAYAWLKNRKYLAERLERWLNA